MSEAMAGWSDCGAKRIKSRTTPAAEAVAQSLAALDWLRRAGCRQFYFKYCSTFDSTAQGNIGPVTEAAAKQQGFTVHIFQEEFTIPGMVKSLIDYFSGK